MSKNTVGVNTVLILISLKGVSFYICIAVQMKAPYLYILI